MDHYFRLANDLAFTDVTRGDRDPKLNTYTCLISFDLTGKERERYCMEALKTCRSVLASLEHETELAIRAVLRVWPRGGRWLQRGMHIGRQAYEQGHYERLTPTAMMSILDPLDAAELP